MRKIALGVALALVLCLGFAANSQFVHGLLAPSDDTFLIKLSFAPSAVESGIGTYRIGHVQLVSNLTGDPVIATSNLQIDLKSQNPEIASVPNNVVVPEGSDYANFDLTIGRVSGIAEITASHGAQIGKGSFKVIEAHSQIPDNINLAINVASTNMQVGTQMPFSVYLENSGIPIQAPDNITVSLQYEASLIQLSSDALVIKKGDYYALGTITALQTAGNAFVKASASTIHATAVESLMVTQTQPASLKLQVFPKKVINTEGTIDVFVGLLDSSGQPTLAPNDISLNFFSNSGAVRGLDMLNAHIKKGEHGFYARLSTLFLNYQGNVTIGTSSSGLGASSDSFQVYGSPLGQTSPEASNSIIKVFTVDSMPGEAMSSVIYQVMAQNVTMGGSDRTYPIQVSQLYSTDTGNLNVVSSNNEIARIVDSGAIGAGHSYGMATIQSGRKSGSVSISALLSGVSFGSSPLTVTSGLNPVQTKIFSPAGSMADGTGRILFNGDGKSDLFFISLDSNSRPAVSEDGVQYLVQPVNDLAILSPGSTFVGLPISRQTFASSNATTISATPVGVNADPSLAQSSMFKPIFFTGAMTEPIIPFTRMIGFTKTHDVGSIQLLDPEGNPILASRDISVTLSSSIDGAVSASPVIIKAGTSFSAFKFATSGKEGNLEVSASAQDMEPASATVQTVLADLPGQFVVRSPLVSTIPGNVTIEAPRDTSVLWGYPSNLQVSLKDIRTSIHDPATGLYLANMRVKSSAAGNVTVEATLLKDGYRPETLTSAVSFAPAVSSLVVLLDSSTTSVTSGIGSQITVSVRDGNGNPVAGALVSALSDSNGAAAPSSVVTDSSGRASFTYIAAAGIQSTTIQLTATKDGYTSGASSLQMNVESGGILGTIASLTANGPLAALPPWVTLAALIGLLGGAGGGAFLLLRRPRRRKFVETEMTEEPEEEEVEEEN